MWPWILVSLLAMVKMLLAIPLGLGLGLSGWSLFLPLTIGGVLGSVVFTLVGKKFWIWLDRRFFQYRKKREFVRFSKGRRRLVNLRKSWGILAIAFLAPAFFSIPLGCMVALKMTKYPWVVMGLMSISVCFWAALVSMFPTIWNK